MIPSGTQIDQLGNRLRGGTLGEADLRVLDAFRLSFGPACNAVVRTAREKYLLQVSARPAKSTRSIIEKLQRETMRLSQMQDIAGCRIVVIDTVMQDKLVHILRAEFADSVVIDRREKPSAGYRAVHVIVATEGRSVEVQVRTVLQHKWAEVSEKLSDLIDPGIKYGGGDERIRKALDDWANFVSRFERLDPSTHDPTATAKWKRGIEVDRRALVRHLGFMEKALPKLVAARRRQERRNRKK